MKLLAILGLAATLCLSGWACADQVVGYMPQAQKTWHDAFDEVTAQPAQPAQPRAVAKPAAPQAAPDGAIPWGDDVVSAPRTWHDAFDRVAESPVLPPPAPADATQVAYVPVRSMKTWHDVFDRAPEPSAPMQVYVASAIARSAAPVAPDVEETYASPYVPANATMLSHTYQHSFSPALHPAVSHAPSVSAARPAVTTGNTARYAHSGQRWYGYYGYSGYSHYGHYAGWGWRQGWARYRYGYWWPGYGYGYAANYVPPTCVLRYPDHSGSSDDATGDGADTGFGGRWGNNAVDGGPADSGAGDPAPSLARKNWVWSEEKYKDPDASQEQRDTNFWKAVADWQGTYHRSIREAE